MTFQQIRVGLNELILIAHKVQI